MASTDQTSHDSARIGFVRMQLFRLGGTMRSVLNRLFYRVSGGENRPVFYDIDEIRPELRKVDASYDVIREELDKILPLRTQIPRYHEVAVAQTPISAGEKDWRVFVVYTTEFNDTSTNRELCPKTAEIVSEVPQVIRAFFSILDPGKSIPAHVGPYLGYIRYHLGLKVPANNPPKIRIKDRYHTWAERESVMFDDSWQHEIYNESDDFRVVLIVDIMRPLPWPLHALNRFFAWYKRAIGATGSTEAVALRPPGTQAAP